MGHRNSGVAFGHANWNAVVQGNRIDYLEDAWFLELVTQETGAGEDASGKRPAKCIIGGLRYDAARGLLVAVRAPAVVIAAGGLSTIYFPKTDAMRGNTGDSYAVAGRAGADLVDMEQVQFLPFCLASPPSYEGLLCGEPSTASFLGVLRDKHGKIILDGVFMRTRAECSSAIMRAVADGRGSENGGAYLDMTGNIRGPRSAPYFMRYLKSSIPSAYANARQALGKAAAKCEEPWEVRPAAHYMMGGVRADAQGASVGGEGAGDAVRGIAGLYAAGQAMGGVFGANRLGSTALTEIAVFGIRAGRAAAKTARASRGSAEDNAFAPQIAEITGRFGQAGEHAAVSLRLDLQREAWSGIGPTRTLESLTRMDQVLDALTAKLDQVAIPAYAVWNQAFIEFEELRNMLDTSRAIAVAARERDGSLGGHVRLDRGSISTFATPYSTVVGRAANSVRDGAWSVRRVERSRTPFKRLVAYVIKDRWRKAKIRALRMLPANAQDKSLEKRYRAIMGPRGDAPAIAPGRAEGAIAEAAEH